MSFYILINVLLLLYEERHGGISVYLAMYHPPSQYYELLDPPYTLEHCTNLHLEQH